MKKLISFFVVIIVLCAVLLGSVWGTIVYYKANTQVFYVTDMESKGEVITTIMRSYEDGKVIKYNNTVSNYKTGYNEQLDIGARVYMRDNGIISRNLIADYWYAVFIAIAGIGAIFVIALAIEWFPSSKY